MKSQLQTEKHSTRSPFGQLLREWRRNADLSQLELANRAESTPRHISFVETGRSRPSEDFVVRLSRALDLNKNQLNDLLIAAGFKYRGYNYTSDRTNEDTFLEKAKLMIDNHSPFPACAVNSLAEIKITNRAFRSFFPGTFGLNAEESIDALFKQGSLARQILVNPEQVLWYLHDRRASDSHRLQSKRLDALVDRIAHHLRNLKRPEDLPDSSQPCFEPVINVGSQLVRLNVTVTRIEGNRPNLLSDFRIEQFYPIDEESKRFFLELEHSPDKPVYSL